MQSKKFNHILGLLTFVLFALSPTMHLVKGGDYDDDEEDDAEAYDDEPNGGNDPFSGIVKRVLNVIRVNGKKVFSELGTTFLDSLDEGAKTFKKRGLQFVNKLFGGGNNNDEYGGDGNGGDDVNYGNDGGGGGAANAFQKFAKDGAKNLQKAGKKQIKGLLKTFKLDKIMGHVKNAGSMALNGLKNAFSGKKDPKVWLWGAVATLGAAFGMLLLGFLKNAMSQIFKKFDDMFKLWLGNSTPSIADESSPRIHRLKRRKNADELMQIVDAKIILDNSTRRQVYVAAEQFTKTINTLRPYRILFAGPPGSGKTAIMKIFMKEGTGGNTKFLLTSGSTFLRYTQQQALNEVRKIAKMKNTVIGFDEADMIIGHRNNVKDPILKAVRMAVMSFMGDKDSPLNIIMTTNDPRSMDGAFKRRFDIIIFVGYPSPAALAKIVRLYFEKTLEVTISTSVANDIVKRLKVLVSTPVTGAQIERITDYIKAITIERDLPVTGKAIQEALKGYASEQKVVTSTYIDNDDLPPTPAEILEREFEAIIGMALDKEIAIQIIEQLEELLDDEAKITEKLIKNMVESLKKKTIDQDQDLTANIIYEYLAQYAKRYNALHASFDEFNDLQDAKDDLIDIVDEQLGLELSDQEAEELINQYNKFYGELPDEEDLEELILSAKELLDEKEQPASFQILKDFFTNFLLELEKEEKKERGDNEEVLAEFLKPVDIIDRRQLVFVF